MANEKILYPPPFIPPREGEGNFAYDAALLIPLPPLRGEGVELRNRALNLFKSPPLSFGF